MSGYVPSIHRCVVLARAYDRAARDARRDGYPGVAITLRAHGFYFRQEARVTLRGETETKERDA